MSGIDFRTLPASIPSLCIPRVFANIDEHRIRRIFEDLDIGVISRVDIVRGKPCSNVKDQHNRVFIHFSRWYNTMSAESARERLINGQDIKVIYDDPWFWKVSAYKEAPVRNDYNERSNNGVRIEYNDRVQRNNDRKVERREQYDPRIYDNEKQHRDNGREQRDVKRRDSSRDRTQRSRDVKRRDSSRDRNQRSRDVKPKSKEQLDKELEKINPTIPKEMRVEAAPTPAVTSEPAVEPEQKPLQLFGITNTTSDCGNAVVYDEAAIAAAKKRKIQIKK